MGREETICYRRLADLLSRKSNVMYITTLAWMRCTLHVLLFTAVTAVCIHGSRSISLDLRFNNTSVEVGLIESLRDSDFNCTRFSNSCLAHNTFVLGAGCMVASAFHLARDKNYNRTPIHSF